MLKRIAVLFAVLALVAAACGGDSVEETSTTTTVAPVDPGQGTEGGTLATVVARGVLNCGVSSSAPGFTEIAPDGSFSGIDVDYCRAIAAVVLGDATKVEFRTLTAAERFEALGSGEIDVLVRNTTWTQTRDTDLTQDFVATTFFDGQQIMGNPATLAGLTVDGGFADIDGAIVCTNAGTTTEQNIKEGAEQAGVTITLQTVETFTEAIDGFIAGTCDIVTTDGSGLFGHRAANIAAGTPGADAWVIFPEAPISKEPLGPLVRENDSEWYDVVQWTVFATFAAEELGINSGNVDAMMEGGGEAGRLLGGEGEKQTAMGLSADAFATMIKAVGNYGEIYERNLGPIGITRAGSYNAQWYDGGLIYSPPFR
jgi:general L-amino acid transport system substrate-binding protein